ncbi:hypothetical protein DY000_02038684 [Brassica cretica]|nr:hypothetical protein DY000_02038684 [Brassica cretica]
MNTLSSLIYNVDLIPTANHTAVALCDRARYAATEHATQRPSTLRSDRARYAATEHATQRPSTLRSDRARYAATEHAT